jgi:hypothetical protein
MRDGAGQCLLFDNRLIIGQLPVHTLYGSGYCILIELIPRQAGEELPLCALRAYFTPRPAG